jgi:hypothetical protein
MYFRVSENDMELLLPARIGAIKKAVRMPRIGYTDSLGFNWSIAPYRLFFSRLVRRASVGQPRAAA